MTDLDELLKKSKAYVDSLTPEQKREMICKQGESWAKAEASWPKPKFHFENGVTVYHSYEDYCNDR